ncbi:di-heme oxidoredictase family protein [Colwellia echini]|uniref:Carbohydrate-binding protein n=1 Tax=Colwellia echini TaxID=1982103 RepID=A0ABY3MV80_9GAMM|nr:di-heme oxidoredictase family protein [Colwellia echini]TYK65110.1 carbohydrate-binding protein [Colwellia echini]
MKYVNTIQNIFSATKKRSLIAILLTSLSACGGEETTAPILNSDIDNDTIVEINDADNDGVVDAIDICPNTPENATVDSTGCIINEINDADNDGVVDAIDICPNTPENATVDSTGCIINEINDADNDGVVDAIDICPNTPENATVDSTGCIINEINDADNDGVVDTIDICPNTVAGKSVDETGCEIIFQSNGVTIQAEDYINYHDTSPTNEGGAGDRNDEVDIEATSDAGGGFNIGYTNATEWLEYSITLETGAYTINTRVASDSGGGQYTLSINGKTIGSDTVSSTGGWQTFVTQNVSSFTVDSGTHTLRIDINSGSFNFNWLQVVSIIDDDNDGIANQSDSCPATPEGTLVNAIGCEIISVNTEVSFANERLVGGANSADPGFSLYVFDNDLPTPNSSACNDECATNWPPVLVEDAEASGVNGLSTITRNDGSLQAAHNGRPLYFYAQDNAAGDINGEALGQVWWLVPYGVLGDVTSLYNAATELEPDTQVETEDALITRFSDRPRTRHAKEDQFQSYDHYIKFYFEDRSSNIEIIDYVAKGGDTIEMNVRTIFPLSDLEAENRWWYQGFNTVAQYASNGIMDFMGTEVIDGVTYYNYQKIGNQNTRLGREIRIGDEMEFEISQFSAPGIPRGQTNYYGTTFLYIVGEGIVPWYTEISGPFPEDSAKIPEEYWLGGNTSMHYQYTDEPDNHFMQMATNLSYDNGQTFLLGRRVHHSSFVDGTHDEDADNGVFEDNVGLSGPRYVNESCVDCHARNGSAPVAENGELLDRWVFKVGDADGNPDPAIGRVLQPNGSGSEGNVTIASWIELSNGLRRPNYQFSGATPATFSARIAPRLVGLGLLEAIPEVDIIALADPTDADGNGISGVANKNIDPENSELTRLGRFGWKAGTSSVRHQVAGALNTDIGVRTSVLPDLDCGSEQANCGGASPIMPEKNLNDLVKYISTLGVRPQRVWKSGVEDTQVLAGSAKFEEIGCVDCHTKTFQTSEFHPLAEVRNQTIHPYTDMLLHDMGPGLADNLGEGLANGSEWRTTPLWGLGLSACVTGGVTNPTGAEGDEICTPHHAYLHDGRARSIEEAILWHGGESENSTNLYKALSDSDKTALLSFLKSL